MFKRTLLKLCALLLSIVMLSQCTACSFGGNAKDALGKANDLATQVGQGVSSWTVHAWDDASEWVKHAWDDSANWVQKAWKNSAGWTATSWDAFVLWINTIAKGNPYLWIQDSVLDYGIPAYESFAALRVFYKEEPNEEQLRTRYDEQLAELSLLEKDRETLWGLLKDWSEIRKLPLLKTGVLALPFLTRLLFTGESAIGGDSGSTVFSGPVVAQYLLTSLETIGIDSEDSADMRIRILKKDLEQLTRPVILGDQDQNVMVTDDRCYIENFTYHDGKYQIILIATETESSSEYPLIRGKSLEQSVSKYFDHTEFLGPIEMNQEQDKLAQCIVFSTSLAETAVTGYALALWTDKYDYLLLAITDQERKDEEFREWIDSITTESEASICFSADMQTDGSFYGINQASQQYTINRSFDEAKFQVPKTGHGWAAERGNNLIDNLKGFIKGSHSTVVGDNNVLNGPDRVTEYANGTKLFIQTKYYASAAQSIAACFDDGQFRYYDAEGKPMAIEVPADQYNAAIEYFKNRILNGEVNGVSDPEQAFEIVKKGSLTYQQARHIAKAGTVESILYDSVHSCVTAGTAMGISAAVSFAVSVWNGEPIETAVKDSLLHGLQSGGTAFIIGVLSSQLTKTGIDTAMIPASQVIVKTLGPDVSAAIVNGFRPAGSSIYGAAAMKSAAKLLRGTAITSAVTFIVLSAGDIADIIRGRISAKQLAINMSSIAAGIVGGALGYLGGAALGTAIAPGAGTVVGIIISVAAGWGASEGAKAITAQLTEDDADEMIRIINEQFTLIAAEYFLNEDEVNLAVENLQGLISSEMLKSMYQYRDHSGFARQLIEMAIDPIVATRSVVTLPSEDEYSEYLVEVLEKVYEDVNNEANID